MLKSKQLVVMEADFESGLLTNSQLRPTRERGDRSPRGDVTEQEGR